jgi:hypothetical protein
MIRHIQKDDLDKPPQRERLPDWSDGARRTGSWGLFAPLLLPLSAGCAVLGLIVGSGLLVVGWGPLQAIGGVFQEMLGAYREHIKLALFLAFLASVAGLVGMLWRAGSAVGALGQRARVVRLQNDQPVDAELLRRPEWGRVAEGTLLEHYLTQRAWADKSGLRNLTTAAPHISYRNDVQALEGVPPLLPAASIPSFGELVAAGRIGQGVPLVLGVDAQTGELVSGSFKSLYSVGVGGLQGSGKTWTAASILAQSATHGARLVICDPHAGDAESLALRVAGLAPAFLCDVAEDDRAILDALKLADDELQARKKGAPARWPLIVAIDEWSSLRRGKLAQLLPVLVEDFSTEGRKFNCHVALLGQRWDKASVGDFRNTLASAFVHRLRPDEARMLTGLPAGVLPNDTMGLAPGESYLVDTRGQLRRVVTPHLTVDDIAEVGRRLGGPHAPAPNAVAASLADSTGLPFGFRPTSAGTQPAVAAAVASEAATSPHQQAPKLYDARTLRIRALLAQKTPLRKIIEQEWGATGGDAYRKASEELLEIIARLIGEGSVK